MREDSFLILSGPLLKHMCTLHLNHREREDAAEALRHARNQTALGPLLKGSGSQMGQCGGVSQMASILEGPLQVCCVV